MRKCIISGIVALLIVLGLGIVESSLIKNSYIKLSEDCRQITEKAKAEKLTLEEYKVFQDEWDSVKYTSQIFMPNMEVVELTLRVTEASAHIEREDYDSAYAQLVIVQELLDSMPHQMLLHWHNII